MKDLRILPWDTIDEEALRDKLEDFRSKHGIKIWGEHKLIKEGKIGGYLCKMARNSESVEIYYFLETEDIGEADIKPGDETGQDEEEILQADILRQVAFFTYLQKENKFIERAGWLPAELFHTAESAANDIMSFLGDEAYGELMEICDGAGFEFPGPPKLPEA